MFLEAMIVNLFNRVDIVFCFVPVFYDVDMNWCMVIGENMNRNPKNINIVGIYLFFDKVTEKIDK